MTPGLRLLAIAIGACALAGGCAKPAATPTASAAAGTQPLSFATPDEAVAALVGAVERGDTAAMQGVLGPGSADLVSSGDAVADQHERERFLESYRAHHELAEADATDLVLLIGADRWPLPIPLVERNGRWLFDGAAGAEELVYRRIGGNELRTIEVMRAYVDIQNEYAASAHDGKPAGAYAGRLRSEPGKHDGLYWEVSAHESPSPAGPLLADAASEGYAPGQGSDQRSGQGSGPMPYHGYVYRMLFAQGPAAQGGARSYLANGRLTGGFALLAYPASYGVSGVMTFMVNQDGTVWQRDLGPDTAQAATAIAAFNPDENWTPIAPEG